MDLFQDFKCNTIDQPKGFRPKPEELKFKRAISAESRNWPKGPVSAERGLFRSISGPKWSAVTPTFSRNLPFLPKFSLSANFGFRLKWPKPFLQEFLVLFPAETEIMPLSVDLYSIPLRLESTHIYNLPHTPRGPPTDPQYPCLMLTALRLLT